MQLGNPLPWFVITALCLLAAASLARTKFFAGQLRDDGRYQSIEGLRGFLALGVFGAHAVNMFTLHTEQSWFTATTPFYNLAGGAGVALFFQVTAFLFWLKVLRAGRTLDWSAFFASRIRRLVPMYLVSVALALFVIGVVTDFTPQSKPLQLLKELRPWFSFGFMRTGEVNGLNAHPVNAVYWSLAYEWGFYMALPLLALASRGMTAGIVLFATVMLFGWSLPLVFHFMFGAMAAILVQRRLVERWIRAPWLAPVPLAALAIYFVYGVSMPAFANAALLAVFFLFVAHGFTLFGLLRTASARVLGTVSYSFYLIHCIVLYGVVYAVDRLVSLGTFGVGQYWLLASLAALAALGLSAVTYRHVECRFLQIPATAQAAARATALSEPVPRGGGLKLAA